jgi:hypothetical protein
MASSLMEPIFFLTLSQTKYLIQTKASKTANKVVEPTRYRARLTTDVSQQ